MKKEKVLKEAEMIAIQQQHHCKVKEEKLEWAACQKSQKQEEDMAEYLEYLEKSPTNVDLSFQ